MLCDVITWGSKNFTEIKELPQNSGCQKGDMKQLPHGVPTNIRYYSIKLSYMGDLANGICVSQVRTKKTQQHSAVL
jgi:hypothetical protein